MNGATVSGRSCMCVPLLSCSTWRRPCDRQKGQDQIGETFWLLFHQDVPRVREQLHPDSARDVLVQLLRPLWPKMRVVLAPEQQRGVIEATQARQQVERDARVSRIELSCEEATRLASAMCVTQVGADVAMQQLRCEHPRIVDRVRLQ